MIQNHSSVKWNNKALADFMELRVFSQTFYHIRLVCSHHCCAGSCLGVPKYPLEFVNNGAGTRMENLNLQQTSLLFCCSFKLL